MNNFLDNQNQLLQERFALRLAARLSEAVGDIPYDVSERLRAARMRALGVRKLAVRQTASSVNRSGAAATLTFGGEHLSWWGRFAAAVPLMALVFGLVAINLIQDDNRANELAEIDSALLTDDLPPVAYTDPGFSQFLKLSVGQGQ